MDFSSLFRIAFQSLIRNKTRSVLTTLGIIIGVAAVILLTSIGSGLQVYISKQFESIGTNNVYVMPYNIKDSSGNIGTGGGAPSSSIKGYKLSDLRAVKQIGSPIVLVSPISEKQVEFSNKGKSKTVRLNSTSADLLESTSLTVTKGRFFTDMENEKGSRVVVLGNRVYSELFGEVDAIGKTITISTSKFKVVGVLKKTGGGMGPSVDDEAYIPISVGMSLFNTDSFDYIVAKIKSSEDMAEGIKKIEKVMEKRRKKDEYSVIDQRQLLDTITGILGILTTAVGGIAAISLVVGGIGIMNIMLVSVTERTREIGLRKAVGATPNVILVQFLIESVVLSLVGGGIGIGIGYLGSVAINIVFPASVTPFAVILAFGVSALVGIIFGILPARRAARLNPIDALRYE